MRRSLFQLFLVVSAGWVGCSSDRSGWEGNPNQQFDVPDAGDGSVDGGCSGLACSRDLRSVVDCSGSVVKECSADLACGDGVCVPPCAAAASNEGSVGCSFSVPGPNVKDEARGSCFAFFVANNWTSPAALHLEFEGKELPLDGAVWIPSVEDGVVKHTKLDGPIPPGGGAVVFLSAEHTGATNWIGCPSFVKPVLDKDQGVYGTGFGKAAFVSSDVPISMYSIFPYGGAESFFPSAMLLLPTTSFRKNYILASAWGGKAEGFGRGLLPNSYVQTTQAGSPTVQIVATEDDTLVELRPRVDVLGGPNIPRTLRNEIGSYQLQRGQVLQLMQDGDLTGSAIQTSKPVGVFGGQSAMFVPSDVRYADTENNQIPPISAWGHEYVVLPAPNRAALVSQGREQERDPSVVQIMAAANGTKLVYEPWRPEGAPETLESGDHVKFFTNDPFVVRSQDDDHPLFTTVIMTGAAASSTGMGDPEVALAVPSNQWLDTYGFFTDYTYKLSTVFVTRRKINGLFQDVNLDCAGTLGNWKSISADFEWTYAEITRDGKPQSYPAGLCTDGAHRIQSKGPFALTVWGLSPYASYAYPGGTGLRPTTKVAVPVR